MTSDKEGLPGVCRHDFIITEVESYCGTRDSSDKEATASKGRFVWSDEMQREWEVTRKIMLEQIQQTPFDPEKSLRLVIDAASTEGAGFVLFQWR